MGGWAGIVPAYFFPTEYSGEKPTEIGHTSIVLGCDIKACVVLVSTNGKFYRKKNIALACVDDKRLFFSMKIRAGFRGPG